MISPSLLGKIFEIGVTPATLVALCIVIYQMKIEVKRSSIITEKMKEEIQEIKTKYVQKIDCEKEVINQRNKTTLLFAKSENTSKEISFIKGKLTNKNQ